MYVLRVEGACGEGAECDRAAWLESLQLARENRERRASVRERTRACACARGAYSRVASWRIGATLSLDKSDTLRTQGIKFSRDEEMVVERSRMRCSMRKLSHVRRANERAGNQSARSMDS